ncbi:dipeptidyl peptidase 8 [Biomphalaria glabrata]|nr:dipeptidyl peptidase 8 [Biomphalaria glabrata]
MASEDFDAYDLPTASPPKPHQGHKKTWQELRNAAREIRKNITRITPSPPGNFQFREISSDMEDPYTRLYFLGVPEKGRDSTLLKVDIDDSTDSESGNEQSQSALFWISPVFERQPNTNAVPMSREEQLMRERKRLGSYGLTSYEFLAEDGLFIFPANNSLYVCYDNDSLDVPTEIPTSTFGARLDPKICPCNSDMVAFIHELDIWLTCLHSGKEIRLTHAHKGDVRLEDDPISAGVPGFVIQEEFDRYTGYWWCPKFQRLPDGRKMYRLLYEEVDETDVEILSIFSPTGQEPNCSELYRYPKAGANNAYSNLKLLEIIISFSGAITQVEDIQVKDLCMKEALFDACPWAEYLSRAGWTPDGKYIYAVLIDRLQMRQAVMLISPSIFYTATTPGSCSSFIQCIYEETSDIWINVHDLLHFFPQTSESEISFIYASEKSGYRHLYLIKSQLCLVMNGNKSLQIGQGDQTDSYVSCKVISEVPITSGQWVVLPKELWVDESKHLVYFMALKDSPLESHLYVTRYDQPSPVQQLTQPCHSHSVHISQDFSKYVTVYSSLNSPPQSAVYKIVHTDWGHIRASYLGSLTPKIDTFGYTPPNLFQYPSRAGHVAYGLYFLPRMREPGKRYPTVLFVYGGPQVQMVSNSFKGQRFLRLHTLAAEGYVVVVIDGRGSSNRGLHFEGVLKNSLGTVEITDQVEGLLWLASQNDFIDMSRVAIHGWSYGGYLSLMGLAQRGDIFKVAIAGAPVVSWELYDTGYTERYIGLPQSNPDVYKAGNVLTYIDMLPDNETKLLLIHGLIDENVHFRHSSVLINHLVTSCKPHQLQIYPNERHGIRNHEASEHYKTTVLKFLQDYL